MNRYNDQTEQKLHKILENRRLSVRLSSRRSPVETDFGKLSLRKSCSTEHHSWFSRLGQVIRLFLWIISLFILLWTATRWSIIPQISTLLLIDVAIPWLLLLLTPLLILSLIARWLYTSSLLGLALLLMALPVAPLFLPRLEATPPHNDLLTVMSFNLWYNNPSPDYAAIAELIQQEQPDILLLQEINESMLAQLRPQLEGLYGQAPLHHDLIPDKLQATISRYPLQQKSHPADKARLQKMLVETDNGTVTLLNVHAFRANFLPFNNPLSYGSNIAGHENYHGQLSWLINEIEAVSGPLILAGDLNVPYQSTDYQAIPLLDSHAEAGWGVGFTFPATENHARILYLFGQRYRLASPVRLVRLDYIFHSPHFVSLSARTLSASAGSDHAPIVAELGWR